MKFIATFSPEAWQNDHAIPVDPQGPTQWEPVNVPENLKQVVLDAGGDEITDDDDQLFQEVAMPEWAKRWSGPFTITLQATSKMGLLNA